MRRFIERQGALATAAHGIPGEAVGKIVRSADRVLARRDDVCTWIRMRAAARVFATRCATPPDN
jgi:hypothetical protein